MVAGAAPPASMIEGMARIGFDLTHVYGLTEVYGPAAVAVKRDGVGSDEPISEQARLNGRQGVRYVLQEGMTVMDPETMREVPADGDDDGRDHVPRQHRHEGLPEEPGVDRARRSPAAGSTPATSRCSSPTATSRSRTAARTSSSRAARTSARSRSRTRSTAIPTSLACAVVARPDPKWGETPLAFVELRPARRSTRPTLVAHCKALLAGYKVPREIRFEPIPKTSTGKIQKFQLRERARSTAAIE